MYQIIKVLNNNAFLARHDDGERILLGKGIGLERKQEIGFRQSRVQECLRWHPKKTKNQV